MNMTSPSVILEARKITKRYPGTLALDQVDYRVYRGQVNVLIGENGAGKSTLMRILAGVEEPDDGLLFFDGMQLILRSPRDAARYGIAIVHQELSVLPNLDITDNLFAGRELVQAGVLLDRAREEQRSQAALQHLRNPMDVRTPAGQLSLGSRQIVEVARTLEQKAKLLILDEPTSALSTAESESLFAVIAELKRAGVTIIYISHRLNELLHIGDHFTVLRSGRVVGEASRSEVDRQWIVRCMSGRDVFISDGGRTDTGRRAPLLEIEGFTLAPSADGNVENVAVRNVSFTLYGGEILGIYGLLGAGRSELLEALAGSRPVFSGILRLKGRSLTINSVLSAVKAGIHLVPEDRQRDGLVPELSIRENMALSAARSIFLHPREETARAKRLAEDLNIRTSDLELPVAALSGGNQQKVIIARCLMCSPSLLLLDEPTRGVDVGAKTEIYAILRRLADEGIGIIFTSSEIEETQCLADRALVLCQGRVAAVFDREALTDEALFAAASPAVTTTSSSHAGAMPA